MAITIIQKIFEIRVRCDEPGCDATERVKADSEHAVRLILEAEYRWRLGNMGGCDFCPAHK